MRDTWRMRYHIQDHDPMNILNRHRFMRLICATTIWCAGCGSPSVPPPPSPLAAPSTSYTVPLNGGAFSASYAGKMTSSGYCARGGNNQDLMFKGKGKASFLHGSKEHGTIEVGYGPSMLCSSYAGSFTLTDSKHPTATVVMSISGNDIDALTFTVAGGTGRFAKAKGQGTLSINYSSGVYSDQWSGKLSY